MSHKRSYKKRKSNSLLLLGFLLIFGSFFISCSGYKNISGKRKIIKSLKETPLLDQNHFSAILIKDLENDEVLIAKNQIKLFTPASNTKLLTFFVADKILPDSIPSLSYCENKDTLYISGLGDPTFLHPDFSDQKAFSFLAESRSTIAYSPRHMEDSRFGPGWAWDDYPYYFQQEKSSFPIYGNSLWIKKDSSQRDYQVIPPYYRDHISIKLKDDSGFKISREEKTNRFELNYDTIPEKLDKIVPLIMSDSLVVKLLSDTLNQDVLLKRSPDNCISKVLLSYPKDSLFKKLLVESDNFFAEQLLLSAGVALKDSLNSERVIDFAMAHYFQAWDDKINWVDGSGLSRYNMLSPDFLISLLENIHQENSWERIKLIFPAAGKEGTLEKMLTDEETFVYAKSGSMTGVYNLSGYLVTNRGNTLAFSIMNNNFNISFKELKKQIESFLVFIKVNY